MARKTGKIKMSCKTWNCFCGNGYDNSRALEYHLAEEHTKMELVIQCKKDAQEKLK